MNHFRPARWGAADAHAVGALAARMTGGRGPILTLEPAFALEGKLDVYAPYVVGVFMFRTEPSMLEQERTELAGLDAHDLPIDIDRHPPAAALTSARDVQLDMAIEDYAKRKGWRPHPLGASGNQLWIP